MTDEASAPTPRHVYHARTERVVDADSVNILKLPAAKLRLLGFDAEEMRGGTDETKALAREQTNFVAEWLLRRYEIVVDSRGTDSFGRELAYIYDVKTGECLNHTFVLVWPETARNPRLQAERITGEKSLTRNQYKPLNPR